MTRYATLFDSLRSRGEGALVPFLMLGDPHPSATLPLVDALVAAGADALELGIPFSDPVADGPVIQRAARRALAAGATPPVCLDLAAQIRRRHPHLAMGLLVYANLVVRDGLDRFYAAAAAAGVDSVLVADAPAVEAAPFAAAARRAGVDPVLIVPPAASPSLVRSVAALSAGYTYVLGRAGVTGAEGAAPPPPELLQALGAAGAPPALVGFGISSPALVAAALPTGAAGAIVGSAVVALAEEGGCTERLTAFVRELKRATRAGTPVEA